MAAPARPRAPAQACSALRAAGPWGRAPASGGAAGLQQRRAPQPPPPRAPASSGGRGGGPGAVRAGLRCGGGPPGRGAAWRGRLVAAGLRSQAAAGWERDLETVCAPNISGEFRHFAKFAIFAIFNAKSVLESSHSGDAPKLCGSGPNACCSCTGSMKSAPYITAHMYRI